MRVLRRRAAAMTPRLKYFALLFTLSLFLFALIYIPTFIYITLIVIVTYSVAHAASVPASLGRNLQAGLSIGAAFRHWLRGQRVTDVSASARSRARSRGVHPELQSEGHLRPRLADPGANYREALPSESLLFSPRDFLMGSYIGKAESPTADVGRPRVVRNPREQLRERLARPNHAVVTPNRRLSFAGETPGAMGRFTIAPQRHYPVQQSGTPAVGVLPPVKWDSFKKKCVLSPRNSQSPRGHISVRIARPEQKIPSFEQLSSPGFPGTAVDPCSRESVLKVLKESRKRQVEVDDEGEDRSFMAEQKRKRTRNESGGSAQSAFEPRLPNGTPSQLVPKPGSLKRGATLGAEESITKRSRTSSISSVSGVHAHRTSASTSRNAIFSSYSSSKGFFQKPSAPSSPMSTPGSSRCQTPEGVAKRPREDNFPSPSLSSTVRAEKTAAEKPPATSKVTPATPKIPITTTPDSTGSGGKRKRKIQLVSVNRDDPIYMPPPPELGYKVTAKDLDDEKKAAFSKIQKILEEAVPEPEKSVASSGAAAASSITAPSSTLTLSSLLAAPLPTTTKAAIPVINLDPSPSNSSATAPAAPNPLLEALKMKSSTSATSTSAALTSTVTSIKPPISTNPPVSSAAPQLSTASQSSAFTQVLAQFSKPPSSTTNTEGQSLLGLSSAATSSLPSLAQTPPAASSSGSVGTTLPTSGFKPIFSVATTSSTSTPESKAIQSIKPIFPSSTPAAGFSSSPASIATSNPPTAVSSNSSSIFGLATSNSTTVPSLFPPMTTPATCTPTNNSTTTTDAAPAKSLFGNFAASTTTNSVLPQAPSGGSSFQFGAAAPVTTSSNSTFSFGASQPQQPKLEAPAATALKFGASATAAAPTAPGTTASSNTTFSFGVTPPPKAEAPSAGSTFQFGASTAAPAATSSTTTNNTFTFGASQPQKTEVPAAGSTFQFGAVAPSAAGAAPAATTAAPSNSTFGFGVKQPEQPPAPTQNAFAFGQTAPSQNSNTSSFGGFGMTGAAATSAPPTTATNSNSTFTFGATKQEQPQASAQSVFGFGQSLTNTTTASFGAFGMSNAAATTTTAAATANTQTPFAFGKSSFEAPAAQPSFNSVAAAPQPFAFGASSAPANNTAPTPFNFGAPAASTAPSFGTPSKPAFGSSSNVFAFGSNTAPSAAPSFAAAPAQTQSSSSGTFAFGAAAPPPGPAAQQPSTGFNFGASMPVSQFGSPVVNNAAPQMGGFNFGAADKPAFGASTPAFGHNAAAAPSPFGTPGTPVQGFSPAPFGSAGTPSFSIGTGSKPAGTRQRLQARRQHNRKK
ncbi:nuclear envelope pore membrane protein POM 121 [Neosynchiropus ocellatus]